MIISPNQSNHPISARVRSMLIDPPQHSTKMATSAPPYRFGSVSSLVDQHNMNNQNNRRSMDGSGVGGAIPVEGRRRARQLQGRPLVNDPYKRASLHEPLMYDGFRQSPPINSFNFPSKSTPLGGRRSHAASTLAIPNLVASMDSMNGPGQRSSYAFGSDRSSPHFINPANQNFILRKSKSTIYDEHFEQSPKGGFRDRNAFPSVDEGVDYDGPYSDDDDEDEDDDDLEDSSTFDLKNSRANTFHHQDSFPTYNPILPSNSYSASSSWLGGLFAPRFTTVSANTAAKSASLSFQQMKSFSGFGQSMDLYDDDLAHMHEISRERKHSTASFIANNTPSIRDRSQTIDSANVDVHHQHPPHHQSSISIPYSALSVDHGHQHHPYHDLNNSKIPTLNNSHHNESISSGASSSVLRSMKSHANLGYSSSSGCSTQSSASSNHSISQHFVRNNKARSSLKEAAQNFRDFVQHYELGLIECISSVEESQQQQQQMNNHHQQMDNQLDLEQVVTAGGSTANNNIASTNGVGMKNRLDHEVVGGDCGGEHEQKEGENGDDDDRRHSEQHDDEQQSRVSPAAQTSTMLPNDNSMSPLDLSSSDHHHNATSQSSPNSPSPDAIATNEGDESPTSPTSPTNESSSLSSPSSPPPSPTSPTSPNLSRSLRLQLAKVRALRDQYETGYRCSEALERLMKVSKRPRDCDREYRANERLMAEIEAQLEAMIGTFRIKVEELEGFARICPRDNYEIEFRHGKQRRVLRVRIGKALERNWDGGTQEVEFRGALKPTIVCRVREIKSRWTVAFSKRNVTLGVTSISMSDLLVAVSKGSTIMMDANASGSLKLRVSCSWQPKLMDGEGGTDSTTKSSTKESSTKLPLVNQSFRSENLDFVSRSSAELQPDRPPKKASTLTSQNFSTSYPSNCTIPESPKSPSKGAPPPISAKPKFLNGFNNGSSNLNRSGDLSRSLLALPSFYYSSSSPNKMMNPKSKDSSSPRAASKSRDFQSTFCLSSPQHRRFPSLNSSLNSSSSSQSLSSSSQHNANSTDNLAMTTPDNGSLNSTPSSTLSRSESNRKATAPISTQSSVNQTTTTNSDQVQAKVSQLTSELCNLQSALEDYRGQYVELTMMSITVGRLFDYYDDLVIEDYHDDEQIQVVEEEIDQMILEEEKDYEIIAASGVIDQNQSKSDGNGENEEAAKASKSKLATTENRNEQPEQPTMIDDIENALAEFDFLECASQCSEKSKDEDNSSARSTPTAMDNATGTGDGSMMKKGQIATDNQDNRLMGRNSLHPSSSSNKCVTSSTNLLPESSKNRTITSESSKLKFLDLWSSVLLLHLNSSLEQLGHVGSWILKGREAQSLARLRADAFAFELIYELLISNGRTNPLGKDRRVIELWQFASDRLSKSDKGSRYRPYIMSWRQLCQILIDLMLEYGLGGTTPTSHLDDPQLVDDDALRYAAEWLSGLMVPLNQTKVTLFDLRAFFELDLWRSARGTGNSASLDRRNSLLRNGSIPNGNGSGPNQQNHQQSLSIKRMFQIALDVDKLMRKCKKISLHSLEQILFDRFNVNCLWIPSDVTLTIVGLLYENHSQEKQSKLTTSEVKKLDRFREMGKMATNWIIWLLQDGRFEIREHVLSGLESSTAFTRRASCYGIMYMFKLMKRSSQYEQNHHRQPPPDIIPGSNSSSRRNSAASSSVGFFGQELDSLLYVSMEDHDGRVRDEARKALKCLGHYGQQRLNQMERSRMGFVGTAGAGASGNGPPKGKGNGQQPVNMLGRSMPNLNKIV